MGNAKSLPVVGEVVTIAENRVKITAAGAFAITGQAEKAEELMDEAGKAWVEYSEKNIIVGPIRAAINKAQGNEAEHDRILQSTLDAFASTVDSVPGVGHVKGVVHYIAGDQAAGDQSMIAASRSTVVVAAGLATGGIGAGAVVGGMASIGGGLAYDGVHSLLDKEEKHGMWNIVNEAEECKSPNDAIDLGLGIIASLEGDYLAGSTAANAGKNFRKAHKVKKVKNELKRELKNVPDIDPDLALKDTIDAARNLEKNINDGIVKGNNHVSTKVRNLETNETGQGFSTRARININQHEFETKGEGSGFPSKTQAKKAAVKPSKFMQKHPEIMPGGQRPTNCSEHAAMDSLPTTPSSASVLQMVSVKFVNGRYQTVMRCNSCLAYAKAMGNVATDYVKDMKVPTKSVSAIITTACKCGGLALGAVIALDTKEINRTLNSGKK